MIGHLTKVVRDKDLGLYGARCECGWESEYLNDDREEVAKEAKAHESEASANA